MNLPLDYSRCFSMACPERFKCARWLDRISDKPTIFTRSNFYHGNPHDLTECRYRIDPKEFE